jgi:hypothetical protein
MINTPIRRLLSALIVCVVTLCSTPTESLAQFGMGGMGGGGMNIDPISKRGVRSYAKLLGMDETQLDSALTLLEGNQQQFRGMMQSLREEMQNGGFMSDPEGMRAKMRDMQTKVEESERQFFDDLKLLLTPEQSEQWPKLERYRRREKFLRFGMVSGAGVDVAQIIERTNATEGAQPELTDALERYELEMDRLLVDFESTARRMQEDAMSGNSMFDPQKIQDMLNGITEPSKKIRDANKDAFRKVAPLLADDKRKAFTDEFNRRSFPSVYRAQAASKLFDAALKLDDLEGPQKDSINELKAAYERDFADANEKLAAATETAENERGGMMGVMMGGFSGQPQDPALKEARDARKQLDSETRDKVMAILTESQRAKLPVIKAERENPWGAMQEMMKEMQDESEEK